MKHSAVQCVKFTRFVRWLRGRLPDCPVAVEAVAVGFLERLWHLTMTNAIRGDIGRLSDDEIAEAVGWYGDASELVQSLVRCGWLDECDTHRLVVHDWDEHAPRHVKGNAAQQGGFVKSSKQGASPKEPPKAPKEAPLRASPKEPPLGMAPRNQTKPNQTLDVNSNEDITSLGCQPAASSGKPPGITRADAQPHAAELFRRLKIRRPEPLFWSVGSAVAAGVVPRTVPYDCADAALGKTNQVAYFRTVYLAECQKRGLMEHQALPRLPPGFGSFSPPEDNGPHYTPEGTGYDPSYDEESR